MPGGEVEWLRQISLVLTKVTDIFACMLNKNTETEFVGTFEVTSGILIVSDPCYPQDEEHYDITGFVPNVKIGTWSAEVVLDQATGRVAALTAYFDGEFENLGCYDIEELLVDSGQMGIFDLNRVPEDEENVGECEEEDSFYGCCCSITSEINAGVISQGDIGVGVVATSGFGDGEYRAHVARDIWGEAYAVTVVFIEQEVDEEDSSGLNG